MQVFAGLLVIGCTTTTVTEEREQGPVATPTDVKAAPPASDTKAPGPERPWVAEPLEREAAQAQARARGMKSQILVPSPVKCPEVAEREFAANPLLPTGPLAGLGVDVEGFLSGEHPLDLVVTTYGPPALCNNSEGRLMDIHLAPRGPNIAGVEIETDDLRVIGLVIELERPVAIDGAELTRRFGAGRDRRGGPHVPHESREFTVSAGDARGTLIIKRGAEDDGSGELQVDQVIVRRAR